MRPFEQIAVAFTEALMQERPGDAFSLLSRELQAEYTANSLLQRFRRMWSKYAEGIPHTLHFDPDYSLDDWPDRRNGDLGFAYVGIEGDEFVEAVSVVVHNYDGSHLIRKIEWGRP
jgi:hypothetical protein